ncbi:unnamed protein product [Absidia cylindrospora]
MPLLKRKPFPLINPPPLDLKDKTSKACPVWYSQATNEIFDDYPTYLERITLYKRPIWQCEFTGQSNITYAEALESEQVEKRKVQNKLPEELQKVVLQRTQFQKARLDAVVEDVHSYFVDRFVSGEQVDCVWDDGVLYSARILETPPLTDQISDDVKYKVQLLDEDFEGMDDYIGMVERKDIKRDRLAFSKNLLKKFLREATTKETYMGAPWIVNDQFAKRFDIDTSLPQDLETAKTLAYSKSRKMRALAAAERRKELETGITTSTPVQVTEKSRLEEFRKLEAALKYPMEDLDLPAYRRNPPIIDSTVLLDMSPGTGNESKTVPNPTGDLPTRPQPSHETVASDCFGPFLMVWSFLNVFSRPLCLSPFNLNDFELALRHTSVNQKGEMVYESIVALLNCIIRHRLKSGHQPPPLPLPSTIASSTGFPRAPLLASRQHREVLHLNGEDDPSSVLNHANDKDDDSSSSSDDSDIHSMKIKQNGNKTTLNGHKHSPKETVRQRQQGKDVCLDRGCASAEVIRIGKDWDVRPIPVGNERKGWEDVLIGCINDLAIDMDENMTTFDTILCRLVPRMKSTLEDREQAYLHLGLKDKLTILQLLVHAANETTDIKNYMEDCQEQLTELRKQKIEINRERKRINADRNELEKQFEDNSNAEPDAEESETGDDSDDDSEDEESITRIQKEAAHVSRHESRQAILKRKQMERDEREAKRKKLYHQQRQEARERSQELKARSAARKKLENEERLVQKKHEQVDRDMRKYSTLRFKPLGRDRFYNRYYYLDNIGGGHSHGSGKLFVQSPSIADLSMIMSDSAVESDSTTSLCGHGGGLSFMCQLMEHQGLSDKAMVLEKEINRMVGSDHLEWWESFDDPDILNDLLAWLNPKGVREYVLKRELQKHLPGLVAGMKKHLSERQTPTVEVIRRSTRTKTTPQYSAGSWFSYTNKLAK